MHTIPESSISQCPFHTVRRLQPTDVLLFPMHKRSIVQYQPGAEGQQELFLFYGDKEISFDEPELFSFGENLAKHGQFIAADALSWGQDYTWVQIQALLQQLIDETVIHYEDAYLATESAQPEVGNCPSPLPPASCTEAHTWLESAVLTENLTGRRLELGYLELVIPIFRVAHIALDAEGRQVGEANVFPKTLRMDIPTLWRTCIYPGSRYLDSKPMNVTALKSMRSYWPQMMACLLTIRAAYLARFPAAQQGWTLAHVEALSTLVLALPTYLLMRSADPIANAALHPALSCLFRVTDGLRVVTHQMIFVPVGEPTLAPSTPISAEEIYAYAERNFAFTSEHGVCAGPKGMIEEFLQVLIDGVATKNTEAATLEPEVAAALQQLQPAFDYGLYGLQVHAVAFSIWPLLMRTYVNLAELLENWRGSMSEDLLTWRSRLQQQAAIVRTQTYHATEELRSTREQAYAEIYQHCAQGLGQAIDEQDLVARLERFTPVVDGKLQHRLSHILFARFGVSEMLEDIELLADAIIGCLYKVQAILKLACIQQMQLNQVLGRPAPTAAFAANLMDIHNLLQGAENRKLPYLLDELEEILGISITLTQEILDIQQSNKLL